MVPASLHQPTYRCPGEAYDIPHAVHVARMAAGFERCRECRHRDRSLATDQGAATDPAVSQSSRSSLFQQEGVRGVYLNEITRHDAGRIAGAFASCLWDDVGVSVDSREGTDSRSASRKDNESDATEGMTLLPIGRPGPTVVLAHDERAAGPDLAMGVGIALRRMGCQVIDVGPVTRPAFWFAVDHLRAAGGVHVTGSGCDPSGIGLDFVLQGVHPCSRGGTLDRIESRLNAGYGRPTRRPGSQRLFDAWVPYEAGLWKHFHALRPLRIALGCSSRLLQELLARLFRNVACRLIPVETPVRARRLFDSADADLDRVIRSVHDGGADLGVLIADDAQQCAVVDDTARLVSPQKMLRLLGELELEQNPAGRIVDLSSDREATLEEQFVAARPDDSVCVGSQGNFWFRESAPTCDAVLTLVRLLLRLSRSDLPLSQIRE